MGNIELSKLNKLIIEYINEKKILNYSDNTIKIYSSILKSFYDFISRNNNGIDIISIERNILLNFININQNISNSTKKLQITVLKSFFKHIDSNNQEFNFIDAFSNLTIKNEIKQVVALDREEVLSLLNLFNKSSISFHYYRDKLIIYILLFTGIRASELLNIKFSDIYSENNMYKILINGKGNKQRYIYIEKNKINIELIFLKKFHTDFLIFTKNSLKQMTRVGLFSMVTNKMKKANVKKQGIHILRHTFAVSLVSNNVNLSTIKDLMGHEDINTTMRYAKSNENNKINATKFLYI